MSPNPFKQLFDLLGFTTTTTPATTITSGLAPYLSPTEYIDVICSQLTYNQKLKDTSTSTAPRDMLARIYLTPASQDNTGNMFPTSPFTIYRNFTMPKQVRWEDKQPIGNLFFQLYDDQGREIQQSVINAGYTPQTLSSTSWKFSALVSED